MSVFVCMMVTCNDILYDTVIKFYLGDMYLAA